MITVTFAVSFVVLFPLVAIVATYVPGVSVVV